MNQPELFSAPKATMPANNIPLTFVVFGVPQPQGSSRAFMPKGWTRPVITSDNSKVKPWRQEIVGTALNEIERVGFSLIDSGPVQVEAKFFFERPKSTKKSVVHKTTKPDLDKLVRSLGDALTGIAFRDDSQVVCCVASKHFGSPARAEISVVALTDSF
jgi:crossover junction endodeoxyribonuclease RusA